jgi:hypothetical protein
MSLSIAAAVPEGESPPQEVVLTPWGKSNVSTAQNERR